MESLLDDGYSPTENIVALNVKGEHVVKEGNRGERAPLKLIHGLTKNVELPEHIQDRIDKLPGTWKADNETIPCVVYPAKDAAFVDKLVARTHAKGDTAGRDKWNSVATARYARDQLKKSEPGLDLLEAYLIKGKNLNPQQAERWSGEYPLTVLNEALQKLTPILKTKGAADLASSYPGKNKKLFDSVLFDIGTGTLGFKEIRPASQSWVTAYGLAAPNPGGGSSSWAAQEALEEREPRVVAQPEERARAVQPMPILLMIRSRSGRNFRLSRSEGRVAIRLQRCLTRLLHVKLETHPHAFCFLLRSLFELSAKAYCVDHKKAVAPIPRRKTVWISPWLISFET